MESDLLLPIFWMALFGSLITYSVRRYLRKPPTKKLWVRPEKKEDSDSPS